MNKKFLILAFPILLFGMIAYFSKDMYLILSIFAYLALLTIIPQPFSMYKYYQSKFLSLLILCLFSFIFSYFFPFKNVFYIFLGLFIVTGLYCLIRKDNVEFDINSELVFLFAFTYFLFFRFLMPDIFGSEQLMDAAFIKSILKAENFPPIDPFFVGGLIDFYYYFGHVLAAGITLMSSQNLEIGFNIAIASISAFSIMISYGFLREVLKNSKKAVAGTLFVLFSGNLYSIYDFFKYILSFQMPTKDYYWDSSRVIEGTINEFPYFTFIHADYHAHFVAIPVKLIYIAMLYEYFKGKRIAGLALIPLTFIIFVTNSWDFPIVTLLLVSTILVKLRKDKMQYTDILIILIPLTAVAAFSSTMNLQAARFMITTERTDLIQFLSFFSIQLLFAYFYLANDMRDRYFLLAILSGLAAIYVIPIAVIILPLMLISLRKAVRGDFFSILIFSSSIIVMLPEIIIIGTKLNTVFKFYLTAWIFFTIAGSIVLVRAIEKPRNVINAVLIILFVLTLIYPTVGTIVRHDKAEMTLDGLNFVKEMSEGDYKAIKWMENKEGVILEVAIKDWGYGGRFAAFTGNPTIIAWPIHELQWRGTPEEIGERMAVVRAIYTIENCTLIGELLKKYNVTYIIVGYQERKMKINPELFDKCGYKLVFIHKETRIYAVEKS